jgi:hypothetical protein
MAEPIPSQAECRQRGYPAYFDSSGRMMYRTSINPPANWTESEIAAMTAQITVNQQPKPPYRRASYDDEADVIAGGIIDF